MILADYTAHRAYAPSHALVWMRRPTLPSLPTRLAIYAGTGAALLLILLETLIP